MSCRLDKDTYDLLKQRLEDLGGISFADFVKESLGLLHTDAKQIREAAWEEGYNEAAEDWQICYYCSICGKPIPMQPNSDSHKAMIGYMKEHRWGHTRCHGQ